MENRKNKGERQALRAKNRGIHLLRRAGDGKRQGRSDKRVYPAFLAKLAEHVGPAASLKSIHK